MFIDARGVPDGTRIDTEVAVVGAGAAGIAIALELAGNGIPSVLLESGGFARDSDTDRLNSGTSDGLRYSPLEECRARFLGGSTNRWGGQCRPLSRTDFESRAWVNESGWPLSYEDLLPYYRRAGTTLRLGPVDYDPARWERRITHPRARLLRFHSNRVSNEIMQFSPAASFGDLYRSNLAAATNIRCFLHANLVEIETDPDTSVVEGLRVATLTRRNFRVVPRLVVLAMGGIENARMLLLPHPGAPAGLGNGHGLVGRYFMEHPSFRSGLFTKASSTSSLELYDTTYSYRNPEFASDGVSVGAYFSLTPETEEQEELLRNRMLLFTTFVGEGTPGTDALRRLLGRSPYPTSRVRNTRQDIISVLRHAPQVGVGVIARRFRLGRLARRTHLYTIVEPEPTPNSRVTLSNDRDALGINRTRLRWQLTPRVHHTLVRAQRILADELRRIGAGDLQFEDESVPDERFWCNHHMGTTRMATDSKHGVVDPTCRVHGMQNLYVAGSSVFPTAGCDMPTYTIVALAIRLADHVRAQFEPKKVRMPPAARSQSSG